MNMDANGFDELLVASIKNDTAYGTFKRILRTYC